MCQRCAADALAGALHPVTYALSLRATPAQQRALDAITSLTRKLGYPPTLREMCDALGLRSTNAVACLLTRLRTKGLVTWSDAKESRTLRVVTEPGETFAVRRCDGCQRDVMVVSNRCYQCEAHVAA